MCTRGYVSFGCLTIWAVSTALSTSMAEEPVSIGSRRELFVDHHLVSRLDGAQLKLHAPQPRESVLTFDQPWEGLYSNYATVLQDGDQYLFYYRGLPVAKHALDTEVTCVALSQDGVVWSKPKLGIYEAQGSKQNNVVLAHSRGCHNLAPFVDTNPAASDDQRFKALGGTGSPGLLAFGSQDGMHWKQLQDEPVITKGAFDSQNNAFWSTAENKYICYFRVFRDSIRWIARTTSQDFIHWSDPVDLELADKPRQHLYTNQIVPYGRAPHIYVGLPTRFMPGRQVVSAEEARRIGTPAAWNYVSDCTDILFVSTRGGSNFQRTFLEAFVRPGPDLQNWTSRANYAVRGILQTSESELSFYVLHHSGYPTGHARRYTIRPDGFVSVHGPYAGGTLVTKPLRFVGRHLTINYATSAAGSVRVEMQTADGRPIAGKSLDDCPRIVGDRIEHVVSWRDGDDVSSWAGQPVRLRCDLRDADLYGLQFRE